MKPSHSEPVKIQFVEMWPPHEPREKDPNYKYFHQAHDRIKKAGLLKCNVLSSEHYGQIELHHDKVEYAHINDIDINKFNQLYGLHLDDKDFQRYVEEEGNLEPLCMEHHRGIRGVHSLPEPVWRVLRVSKDDHPIAQVDSNSEIPVQAKPKGEKND